MATNEHGEDLYPVPVARRPLPPALLFGRTFLRHPRLLGSVVPSSRFLISRVLRQADWSRTKVVVEAGPGVGTLTGPILDRLGATRDVAALRGCSPFVRPISSDDDRHRVARYQKR